jgi:hypothetical protein
MVSKNLPKNFEVRFYLPIFVLKLDLQIMKAQEFIKMIQNGGWY